jgi:hypothetical protein
MFYRATREFPKTRQHVAGPAPDHQNIFAISDDGCSNEFHRAMLSNRQE